LVFSLLAYFIRKHSAASVTIRFFAPGTIDEKCFSPNANRSAIQNPELINDRGRSVPIIIARSRLETTRSNQAERSLDVNN